MKAFADEDGIFYKSCRGETLAILSEINQKVVSMASEKQVDRGMMALYVVTLLAASQIIAFKMTCEEEGRNVSVEEVAEAFCEDLYEGATRMANAMLS